ncbi:hypothetical protein JTB14_027381 [Gonioctena quinquepunctata]|nr:hypothetical protein JTB14_027381 [Gonioctena quinquepunctata]
MSDDFDIKTLPSNFVSISRPSEVIKKLNEKRRAAHNETIGSMRDQMRSLNEKVDEEIRKVSEIYMGKIEVLKDDAAAVLRDLSNKTKNIDDFDMEVDTINKVSEKLSEKKQNQLETVDGLYNKLLSIEKNRSTTFKSILKQTKEELLTIAHELPMTVEDFFGNELVCINQITMSNHQNYAELQRDLKLQVNKDMKIWSEELLEVKEVLKDLLKVMVRKSVIKITSNLKQDMSSYVSGDLTREIIKIRSLHSAMAWNMDDGVPVSTDDVEKWLKDVQKTLASLDLGAKNIIKLYKSIIIILFNRFFSELEDLKKIMMKTGIVNTDEIEEFQSEIYTPTIDELNAKFEDDFAYLQDVWGNTLNTMKDTTNETYQFLKSAAFLWDNHFHRIKELQKIVLNDLAKMVGKNIKAAGVFEVEINITMEKLRQGSNENKLEKLLAEAAAVLNNLEKTYGLHHQAEIQILQKYETMMDVETDVLMAEIKRFLISHPPDSDRDPKKQRRRASQMSEKELDPTEYFIPSQIMYITFQVDAVKNWMFGLWEAIDHYLTTCKSEISVITQDWIEKQSEKIKERFKVTLAFHKPRYFSLKCFIYEKRLMELMKHSDRYQSHKMAAEEEIKRLKEIQSSNDQKFTDVYEEFLFKRDEILNKVNNFGKSQQVRGFLHTVHPLFKEYKKKLKEIEEEYAGKCLEYIECLRIANYQYLKASKSFSDEGNFNMTELEALQKNLVKLEQFAEKTLEKCMKEDKTRLEKYNDKLLSAESTTVSTFEELIQEHEHNENVVKMMKELQRNIRNEVVSLKTSMKIIEHDIKKFMEQSEHNIENEEFLSAFSLRYDELIPNMQVFTDFIDMSTRSNDLDGE